MVKDMLSSFKSHLEDRISNPILGAFCLSWFFCNWKLILFLLFSEKTIEDKVQYISLHYTNFDTMIWYPAAFTIFYLLIFPWMLLGVQVLQEKAISQRRTRQLITDTAYLSAKVNFVRAESDLDSIRLQHELQREIEIKSREMELEREKLRHNFDIERERRHMEFEFEERKSSYEDDKRRRDFEFEHENKMRQIELEENRRRKELEYEDLKINRKRRDI